MYGSIAERDVAGTACLACEGETDRLWLGSVRNPGCRAPFSPTWLASAYEMALEARRLGCREAVDVGSGDGRIAYCAAALGMRAHSVELDRRLAAVQREAAAAAGARLDVIEADGTGVDYRSLGLSRPAFFIGGLAQMGGDALAAAVIRGMGDALGGSVVVMPGTRSPKYAPDPSGMAGWGSTVAAGRMRAVRTTVLPTAWTNGEPDATPYLFARAL